MKSRAFRRYAIRAGALTVAGVLVAGAVGAATDTDNLAVSATVLASCTIAAAALGFGNYNVSGAQAVTALDAQADLTVTCSVGVTTTISLDEGASEDAGSTPVTPLRQMASGLNRLDYTLYQDPTRLLLWGTGGGNDLSFPATGATDTVTVYGSIAGGQLAPAGAYTDTVVATITF
jgi:spore coat protein U-like protein